MSSTGFKDLQTYINSRIRTNGQELITGAQMNQALNGILDQVQSNISIPRPMVSAQGENIYVYYTAANELFRQFNPEYFLFRYRRGKRTRGGNGRVRKSPGSGRWVHPTHLNGSKWSGRGFFSGLQQSPGGNDAALRLRETEWPLTAKPYERSLLSFHGVQYYRDLLTNTYGHVSFPQQVNQFSAYPSGNQNGSRSAKAAHFRVAIAIDNPFYKPDDGSSPKIFGAFSDVITYFPQKQGDYFTKWGIKINNSFPKVR
jgi:hypothetical protein